MTAALAAALLGAAAALLLPPRPRLLLPAGEAPRSGSSDQPLLRRWRPLLAAACGVGGWVFFGGVLGLAAGAGAAVFAWRVLGRVESAETQRRAAALDSDLPGALDLLVSAFVAGLAPGSALALVAEALPGHVGEEFTAICRRLDLGTDPATVWRELTTHPQLGPLGRALGRAHGRGTSVVVAGERLAEELREQSAARVEARARSVSTRAAAPLGACFLPRLRAAGHRAPHRRSAALAAAVRLSLDPPPVSRCAVSWAPPSRPAGCVGRGSPDNQCAVAPYASRRTRPATRVAVGAGPHPARRTASPQAGRRARRPAPDRPTLVPSRGPASPFEQE